VALTGDRVPEREHDVVVRQFGDDQLVGPVAHNSAVPGIARASAGRRAPSSVPCWYGGGLRWPRCRR
jgi:hypothetical protein